MADVSHRSTHRSCCRDSKKENEIEHDKDEMIHLEAEAAIKRCGIETRLVIPPANAPTHLGPRSALLEAIALAHDWKSQLIEGKLRD